MMVDTVADFVRAVRRSGVLDRSQLAQLDRSVGQLSTNPRDAAREMIRRTWLTPYQANQILLGNGSSLLFGSYVLLERLGEGGMGQVFKARHQKLGRVVALKVIRQEKATSRPTVRRFRREIKASAQLSHPNIVMAFDADQAGDIYFLVMEYVEGIDLSEMVKRARPAAGGAGQRLHSPGRRGAAARPRARPGPSRHQAAQLHRRQGRSGQVARSGPGPASGRHR